MLQRKPDAGTADTQLGQVHDLPALVLHFHLFAGVALELLAADLGNQVEGDLVGEHLGLVGLAVAQGLHHGIISNPNCSTIITVTAVNALNKLSPIRTMTASTYQAVSGAGAGGPIELMNEVEALREGKTYEPKVFSHQIAYNLIPQIGGEQFEGYTSEEMKMQNEGRKIMHLPELRVSCTCVRVPVVRSHSISVSVHFDKPVTVEQAREVLKDAPGVKLVDDLKNKQYPMPLDTSDQDIVFVGRIRPDLTDDNGLCLWCCGDQVRKGAATNAIQIAELLVK